MSPASQPGPTRAAALAARLRAAVGRFVAVVQRISLEQWAAPRAGRWTLGKEVEHVAEALVLHAWSVRLSVGEPAGPPPTVDRGTPTARASAAELAAALRAAAEDGARLVDRLTDAQLASPAQPTRTRTVEKLIDRVLIGHVERHHLEVERALRRPPRPIGPDTSV